MILDHCRAFSLLGRLFVGRAVFIERGVLLSLLENHTDMLEQTNIQHAIVGEMNSSLIEIMRGLNKTRISALAKVYNISGRSKMKKDELVLALQEQMTNPAILRSGLLILDAEEWAVFESVYRAPYVQDNFVPYGYYHILLDLGLVFTYFNDNKLYLIMPDEVKNTFKQVNTDEFQQARSRQSLVLEYIEALTNLYGVYTTDKLLEIFNTQNESEPLNLQELNEYLEHFLSRQQKFALESGFLIDSGLAYDDEEGELEALLQRIQGKPYYVPNKTELLKYADDSYFEITPQLTDLGHYVLSHMSDDKEMVEYLIDDIQFAASLEIPLQGLLYEFEKRNLTFADKKQAEQVIKLLKEVCNHTRLWSNCGHTPNELRPSITNSVSSAKKVGRNEPCPCGSGLKYKKCCGK